ncbi:MAG: hypothetical protein GY832_38035 [Chloroflexi bacterium]|nr:hypothetical protein [Chloroflexota bacterium]
MSKTKNLFFYAFEVLPENEKGVMEYMEKFGTPTMSKYCQNWQLFTLNQVLRGDEVPQYIGFFEIPDLEAFLGSEPPEEMKETMKQAGNVCSNVREWISDRIASNI